MNIPREVRQAVYSANGKIAELKPETENEDDSGYNTRHVLNLSEAAPNLSLAAIEAGGVSLEDLGMANIPVCYYKTQVTLHGNFPEFTGRTCRATGYRCLIQNGNGSIGIRWIAVDGAKKALIRRAIEADRKSVWAYHQNSSNTGLTYCQPLTPEGVANLAAAYKSIPRGAYIGSAGVYRVPLYGLAFVAVNIAAVPEKSLWEFIGAVCRFKNMAELEAAENEACAERERRQAEYKAQRQAEREKESRKREGLAATVEKEHGLRGIKPDRAGHYIGISGAKYFHYAVSLSFGRLCYRWERVATLAEAIEAAQSGRKIASKGRELPPDKYMFLPPVTKAA